MVFCICTRIDWRSFRVARILKVACGDRMVKDVWGMGNDKDKDRLEDL